GGASLDGIIMSRSSSAPMPSSWPNAHALSPLGPKARSSRYARTHGLSATFPTPSPPSASRSRASSSSGCRAVRSATVVKSRSHLIPSGRHEIVSDPRSLLQTRPNDIVVLEAHLAAACLRRVQVHLPFEILPA